MRTPLDIYEEYRIMPGLQLHQLRVAAVGQFVCDALNAPVDTRSVVLACLFHDMGNIIKSDFTQLPDLIEEKGASYWEGVKAEFVSKYGTSAHAANVLIAKEIPLPENVAALIDGIGFGNIDGTLKGESYEQKICQYADTRVGPYGILSQEQRLSEAYARSQSRGKSYYTQEGYAHLSAIAHALEAQLFEKSNIQPGDITDSSAEGIIEELKHFQVGE